MNIGIVIFLSFYYLDDQSSDIVFNTLFWGGIGLFNLLLYFLTRYNELCYSSESLLDLTFNLSYFDKKDIDSFMGEVQKEKINCLKEKVKSLSLISGYLKFRLSQKTLNFWKVKLLE